MSISGVVFDYSVLLGQDRATAQQLNELLNQIRASGLKIVVVSTHRKNLNALLALEGLPPADHVLFRAADRKNSQADEVPAHKGSPLWMLRAAEVLGCKPHELVSIGDEHCDWTGAIGAAVLHLHAGWICKLPESVKTFSPRSPAQVWVFLTHFLTTRSRYKFAIDIPGPPNVHFRSLYTANETSKLNATTPPSFTLVEVFASDRRKEVNVGPVDGGSLLMVHTLTSLYEEGLIDRYSRFTVYPGHTPGTFNPTLAHYVDFLANNVQAYDRNILERWREAPDTSSLRRGNAAAVSYKNQTDTVRIHPNQQKNVKGKSIVVFDDFTTMGYGLDWARNLLVAGGAKKVVLVTIGKFVSGGIPSQVFHDPAPGVRIDPFATSEYPSEAFVERRERFTESHGNGELLQRLFCAMRDHQPFTG